MKQVRVRRWLVGAVLAALVAAPAAAWLVGSRLNDNCASINRVVDAGSKILDPQVQLEYAREHHLVTPTQYSEQLARARQLRPLTQHYLAVWRSGECR